MDWKRFFMSACCLLVVCCLIINISPIRAEATTVAAAATVVALPSLTVIACCLIGLGIMAAVVTTDWEQVVNDCSDFLKDVGFVDDEGNINVYAITDGAFTYGVTQELVETVREWMFDSGAVAESVTSFTNGFTCSSISSTSNYPFAYGYGSLAVDSAVNAYTLLQNLGVNQDVMIVGVGKSSPYYLMGIFFDESGILTAGKFENTLGGAHASLLGVYSLSSLELIVSDSLGLRDSSYNYGSWKVFYNQSYASEWDSFLTSSCFAFDFSSAVSSTSVSTGYVRVFKKLYTNSVFNSASLSNCSFAYTTNNSDVWNFTAYYPSAISWVSGDISSFESDYDIVLGAVAGAGVGLAAGYAAWYAGALTFPGVDVGSDDEEVVVLPAGIGQTLGEMATYTQADVWAGVSTYEDTTTDTDTGVITGTFADTAIGTFINALVDALTSPLTWLGGFILDGIKAIFADTSVGSFIDTLTDALLSPLTWLGEFVLDGIRSIFGDTTVGSFIDILTDALLSPLTWLGEFLLDGIKAIFVPSEDFLTDKVNALRENFGFADSIMTTFEMFTTSLFPNSTSPPVIYVDLSAASGSYYLGEKIVFIDMSFYAPYKATGDIMISAFLWLMFIWRVGIRLPGIIRGASGVVNFANAALVDKHFNS